MQKPLISIAMATYNGERFLREQLDSIFGQTYKNFELIVCDDCSTDNTLQILLEYEQKYPCVRLFKSEQNIGFKKNFEKAILLCSGEYIALCDQDDIWYPNHLEVLLTNIGENRLCCGNSDIVDENNNSLNKRMSDTDKVHFLPENRSKFLYREIFLTNPLQGASMLLQCDFAKKCVPIPNVVKYHDAWLATCACAVNGLNYLIDIPVTRYRQHTDNVTQNEQRVIGGRSYAQMVWNDFVKGFKTIFRLYYAETDRFVMVEKINEIFHPQNIEFKRIFVFLKNAQKHKLTRSDVCLLWRNIDYITTTRSSKWAFLRYWFIWSHMQSKKE